MNVLEQRQAEAVVSIARTLRTPDWEQRRYEIAKEMLPLCVCEFSFMDDGRLEKGAEYAVLCADALIAELQKGINE